MFLILTTLWFVWEVKYLLFWIYLWQLKDYHIGRFLDHFRTHKGRELIFNFVQIFKLVLLILFLTDYFFGFNLFVYLFSLLFLVYFFELVVFLKGIFAKSVKKPIKTPKTIFLTVISLAAAIVFLFKISTIKDFLQPQLLLGFDVLTPIIVSLVVLLFQPFFVVIRNNALRKARHKIERIRLLSKLKVIAVTGSYGKTSTKEFLATILSKKYKVLKTKNHQNSEIGVANCILQDLEPSHQILIAEIGAYNKGKVKEVCSILKPNIGVVTGVNEQHLALFGSFKKLLSAEGGQELAAVLPKSGLLVVNGDNKYCLELYKRANLNNKKIYSLSNKIVNSDIWSEDVAVAKDNISFVAVNGSGELAHFEAKVLGKQNVQNLLGAILIAKELGMSFEEISEACRSILQEQAGIVLKHGKHDINIIDSSYSANPDGVFADLDFLSIFLGKKFIVMPCLIELGKRSCEIHRKIGRKIGEVCDLAIITTKDYFKEVEEGFNEAKSKEVLRHSNRSIAKCLLCDNPQDIYSAITLFCKSGDAVLLEGRVSSDLINLLIK